MARLGSCKEEGVLTLVSLKFAMLPCNGATGLYDKNVSQMGIGRDGPMTSPQIHHCGVAMRYYFEEQRHIFAKLPATNINTETPIC